MLRRMACLLMVFLSGMILQMNLSSMQYGIPSHYTPAWWKVGLAILLGIMFGALSVKEGELDA